MSKVMRFYNPKTKQYELINAGGVLDEDTNEILTGKDINNKADFDYVLTLDLDILDMQEEKADKEYVDDKLRQKADKTELSKKADKNYVDEKISNIDINQFEAINKGGYSFNNLKESGVYRLWNSSTSPCKTNADYITVVYKYNNKIIQVAHSSSTSSQIENRVYVRYYTGSYWTSWRELTNVDVEKEIDNLKTSGVEVNKILVDALNSKGVWASTSGSIKTNANKVKNIKVGDYSIGDIIYPKNLKPVWDDRQGIEIWKFTGHNQVVNSVAVDNDGYVYSGSWDNKLMKISPQGNKIWEFAGHNGAIESVAVDNQGYVYSGGYDNRVMKISSQGNKIWEFTKHNDYIESVAVDSQGYVYSGSRDNKLMKISSQGSKIWEFTGHNNRVYSVAVDNDDYVYSGGGDNKVMKISSQGNKIWEFTGHSNRVNSVAVDNDGYVYSGGGDSKVMKISSQGNKIWEFTKHSYEVYSVAVDNDGYVYSGGGDRRVIKTSPQGNEVWRFVEHGHKVYSVAVGNDGYIYSGSADDIIRRIQPGSIIRYEIIT